MSNIGITKAFSLLINGEADRDAKMFRTKQLCILAALVGTIASPFIAIFSSLPYQGSIPPQAPLVKEQGVFAYVEKQTGMKKQLFAVFRDTNGKTYRLQDRAQILPVQPLMVNGISPEVSIEGFSLRDGKGLFWVTKAHMLNGHAILKKSEVEEKLELNRNPFGWGLFWLYVISGLFWIATLINAVKIINKSRILNK